jgi:uncharacterized protein
MRRTGPQAIDVHAHYGIYIQAASPALTDFMSGDETLVIRRAGQSKTRLTFVSPLAGLVPRHEADPVAANRQAFEIVGRNPELRQWVIVDPQKPDTYAQADELLAAPQVVGIKIHPEEHGYRITDHGRTVFEFAAKRRAVLITHSGEPNSLPADFVPFANDFPEVILILAHLGCGHDGDPTHQIRAVRACTNGNVYVDTSSATNIMPGLLELAVREIGSDRILYGTDSPLYFAPMQRARIDSAEIRDVHKKKILYENAERLFRLDR